MFASIFQILSLYSIVLIAFDLDKYCRNLQCPIPEQNLYCYGGFFMTGENLGTYMRTELYPDSWKEATLDSINYWRNVVACDNCILKNIRNEEFPTATKMPEVVWDDELEFMSRRYVLTCTYGFSGCTFLSNHERAGVLISKEPFDKNDDYTAKIEHIIWDQFSDFLNVGVDQVDIYNDLLICNDETLPNEFIDELKAKDYDLNARSWRSGFPYIASEKVTKVGCAVSYCQYDTDVVYRFTVCHYNYGNGVVGQPLYEKGLPASRCPGPISTKYCCLCEAETGASKADKCVDFTKFKPFMAPPCREDYLNIAANYLFMPRFILIFIFCTLLFLVI